MIVTRHDVEGFRYWHMHALAVRERVMCCDMTMD